jgi:hypothetical protein
MPGMGNISRKRFFAAFTLIALGVGMCAALIGKLFSYSYDDVSKLNAKPVGVACILGTAAIAAGLAIIFRRDAVRYAIVGGVLGTVVFLVIIILATYNRALE